MHEEMKQDVLSDSLENLSWTSQSDGDISGDFLPPRILMLADISGAGPEYHVGDEAMAEVAINRLKALVGAENLVMACAKPAAVPATYGIAAFPFYSRTDQERRKLWWRRPLSAVKANLLMFYHLLRCDVVFVCGGGNLTSVWPGVLEARLHLLKWARRLKKRLILVSQTLGPFSPEHEARCRDILSGADWIGVRDRKFSANQLGLPVHFAVDDAAFLEPKHSAGTRKVVSAQAPAMALSFRQFGGVTRHHLLALCSRINRVARHNGLNAIFIPHHSPGGGGDTAIAKDVQQHWDRSVGFTVIDPIPLASELKALTGDCELVISMRYHQLIFGLSMGVPSIGIYVDKYTKAKLNGAFEQFGLEPRIISIDQAHKLESLVEQVKADRVLFRSAAAKVASDSLGGNLQGYRQLQELSAARAD
ncbi:polysaccharide pyruvyl transferase family protein [Gilvimarinus sp. F26214L]|uniref:polysaccharide pyruvyl transferase family protein n=1 Tax=Gilvimarinus sp. DZF01 TaxID=3461371 RepID=UPI004045ABC7